MGPSNTGILDTIAGMLGTTKLPSLGGRSHNSIANFYYTAQKLRHRNRCRGKRSPKYAQLCAQRKRRKKTNTRRR